MKQNIELTILIPTLNEEKTIGIVIDKAKKFIKENNINAEILVANNNSTDRTKSIAEQKNVRIIDVTKKGYGITLITGIKNSKR